MRQFDYTLDYKNLDLRSEPGLYVIGKGEQGVLTVEPYKSEILPHWKFKNPEVAKKSSEMIYSLFLEYINSNDFIGADMARKFLQMGFTRARRYANYSGGKKYIGPVPDDKKGVSGSNGRLQKLRGVEDPIKAESARIFKAKWDEAKAYQPYLELREDFIQKYGR
ncbi:DUF4385 domain-containing protein [Aggregatimonas sangjinii]|uniref:DUF4385 domain-containing protein n=1 Tax=Aggregatimonas sangjinii TaxID=2583587 RepID=A0A5B7STC9_9FLAO|nr:DUF4385 domain-containing protein [Aggregatimonas sangjinii]QCX00589.1 DUF4385 domain-containing protein [Aggregatimonas sangjinii]